MAVTLTNSKPDTEDPKVVNAELVATLEHKIQDLAIISEKLVDVLKRENAALKAGEVSDFHVLADEKTALSRIFESRLQGLTSDKVDLSTIDPDLRTRMRDVAEQIGALMEENGRRLRTSIAANKRVVELIQSAVKDSRPGPSVYSAKGQKGYAQRPAQAARGMSISFDSVL